MILATLTLTLPLPISGAHLPDGEDDVARIIDVSSLTAASESVDEGIELPLLPLMRGLRRYWMDDDDEFAPMIGALAEVFMSDFGDGVERFDVFPDGQVYLQGTTAAVERFEEFVKFFESAQASGPELEVIRFQAKARSIPGEIERGALMARLEGMPGSASRERVSIPLSGTVRIFDQESTSVSARANVEIAQNMAVLHAEVVDVLSGFELLLATGPDGDGLRAAYVVSQLDRSTVGDTTPVTAEIRLSSTERGLDVDDRVTWQESMGLEGGSLAGEMRLRPGHFTVLELAASGDVAQFIALGLASEVRPAPTLTLDTGQTLHALGHGALGRPMVDMQAPPSGRARSLSMSAGALNDDESLFTAQVFHMERDMWISVFDEVDAQFMEIPGGMILVHGDQEREAIERRLALAEGTRPARLSVRVQARSGSDGPRRAGSFVATSGSRSAVVLGQESLTAKRYEVEVAQSAASREPVVETHFEGLAATMTLSKLRDGRLAYRVEGQLTEDLDVEESSANSLGGDGLVGYHSAHLGLNARGTVAPNRGGGWTVTIGDSTGMRGAVTLDVSELK